MTTEDMSSVIYEKKPVKSSIDTLQHFATHGILQHTATHCNTHEKKSVKSSIDTLQHFATHGTLQHTTTHHNTATHCNTLLHTPKEICEKQH